MYLTVIFAVFAFCITSLHIADERAARLINAVEEFHADHNRYPYSLQQLVPKYVKVVPPVKLNLMSPYFLYSRDSERRGLGWYEGKELYWYYFNEKKWKTHSFY
jgi:hypothetical protein